MTAWERARRVAPMDREEKILFKVFSPSEEDQQHPMREKEGTVLKLTRHMTETEQADTLFGDKWSPVA